jgi:hypothetical protein
MEGQTMTSISAWSQIVVQFSAIFTQPTAHVFAELISGWSLCPTRKTVTGMIGFMHPKKRRPHDAYHRFFPDARWSTAELWRRLLTWLIEYFYPTGVIPLDLDDTVFHRTGRRVSGAGWWRDAVRSTGTKVIHCWGLNLVVLTLRVIPPWAGEPLGLPINLRLHRKKGPSLIDLAEQMLIQITEWLDQRSFSLCADGFYASLAGRHLSRMHLTSRMRCDAAIYELPPKKCPQGKRGPKPKKGKRLPTPLQLAKRIRKWDRVDTQERGHQRVRLVYTKVVIWYKVSAQPVLLVVSRDPEGKEKDDFFFTTDIDASGAGVIETFAGRWSIEDTFKNTKQYLGAEQPQTWKGQGPERAAVMGLWLYSVIWAWYIRHVYRTGTVQTKPWYLAKVNPSFQDALAALRRVLWRERIIAMFEKHPVPKRIANFLVDSLSAAA